jgi:hypothetical protein
MVANFEAEFMCDLSSIYLHPSRASIATEIGGWCYKKAWLAFGR